MWGEQGAGAKVVSYSSADIFSEHLLPQLFRSKTFLNRFDATEKKELPMVIFSRVFPFYCIIASKFFVGETNPTIESRKNAKQSEISQLFSLGKY